MTKRKWLFSGLALSLALMLTGLILVIAHAAPDYLYVKSGGTGDCSSWANACDLQTALTTAVYGDEIWVAADTYTPTTPSGRNASFQMKAGVAIYGGFDGTESNRNERDWTTNVTTLSGDIGAPGDASDNAYHVVNSNAVTETAVLDGFTITGGNADGSSANRFGGGMYNTSSNPVIENVIFDGNTADYGGGMYNNNSSSPAISDATFQNNEATEDGGGMLNNNSSIPVLSNVAFDGNQAINGYGGGMANNNNSAPMIFNATFKDNIAGSDGGGMHNNNSSDSTVGNTVFVGNQASGSGGGMATDNSSGPTVSNVTFYENSAGSQGGGLWSNTSNPTVSNSIFWNNTATTGAQIHTVNGTPSVSYSLVQGGYTGTGNVSGDPNFTDAANDDFTLDPGSAAIDAGDNTAVLPDTADLDENTNTTEPLPQDKAGADRFLDVAGTPDTGNGTAPIVDMGAYEASFVELQITKAVEPSDAMPGQPVTYTLVFSNAGSLTAHGVVITDVVPTELTSRNVASTGAAITDSGATPPYVWNVADLAPGDGGIITITGKVDPTLAADTTMGNSAAIDTTDDDIDPTNNSGSGSTSVTVPRIQLSSDAYQVGESDGTATFTVTLDTANPYADVTVQYTSSDGTATAGEDYTAVDSTQTVVSGATSANFTVSITPDEVDEEDETLTLTLSNPSGAAIDAPGSATLTIQDDDTAGINVDPTSLTISEPSGSDTFTITLDSEPTAAVTIDLASLDTSECTVPVSVTLDASNWNTGVVVTVQAVDDWIDDGDLLCTVQTTVDTTDPDYAVLDPDDVDVTVQDDDTAGIVVDPTALTVSEPNGSDSFTITLTSEPTATVTIDLASLDTSECTVPVSVTLDAGNWNTGVSVAVQAVNDDLDDGPQDCVVQTAAATSDDPNYDAMAVADVTVSVQDEDGAGTIVMPTAIEVSEDGAVDHFQVVLTSEPTATVTVTITTDGQTLVNKTELVFTPTNWDTPQVVTVSAVDDDIGEWEHTGSITNTVTSDDPNYDGVAISNITVTIIDNDIRYIYLPVVLRDA